MKIAIIRPDGIVGINGFFIKLDLSSLPERLRVVQWIDDHGFEEWTDRETTQITNLVAYDDILSAWQAAKLEIDARAADPYYGMTPEEKAAAIAESQRLAAIEAEQTSLAFHNYTPEQVKNYIDNQFSTATTALQIKAVVQDILKKMAIYILK